MLTYKKIIENDYVLSPFSYSNSTIDKKISELKKKYDNLMNEFKNFDGYAFSSTDFMDDKNLSVIPLIQINNVNENFSIITKNQNFKYLPINLKKSKKNYLLNVPCVLISLTGGADKEKDISIYFDGSFEAFLNQRVCAFSAESIDLLYYFYALTYSSLFKEQWMGNGGVQKNTGKKEKENLYLPYIKNNETIRYISLLIQAIINKDKEINNKHYMILEKIHIELKNNQSDIKFKYALPTINEIMNIDRMDSCLYTKEFKEKEFLIKNYKNGTKTVKELGFNISRGQNLQVSNIGKSIQTKEKIEGFYTLMLPKFLTKYGTVDTIEYIGNKNRLKTLVIGDIIFGAEGNEKGRSIAIIENKENTITNIHGITLKQKTHNINNGIFVKLFLDYLRDKGMIDDYAVGGNGGSLSIKYWDSLQFPNFPDDKEKEVVKLYHNPLSIYNPEKCSLEDFLTYDNEFNKEAGIYELDKSKRILKENLDKAIENIINDIEVKVNFNIKA